MIIKFYKILRIIFYTDGHSNKDYHIYVYSKIQNLFNFLIM